MYLLRTLMDMGAIGYAKGNALIKYQLSLVLLV